MTVTLQNVASEIDYAVHSLLFNTDQIPTSPVASEND